MQRDKLPPSAPADKSGEQPQPKGLFLEFEGVFEPYGTVVDLDTISDVDLRAAVKAWLKPHRPGFHRFIVACDNIGLQLVELRDGFKISGVN